MPYLHLTTLAAGPRPWVSGNRRSVGRDDHVAVPGQYGGAGRESGTDTGTASTGARPSITTSEYAPSSSAVMARYLPSAGGHRTRAGHEFRQRCVVSRCDRRRRRTCGAQSTVGRRGQTSTNRPVGPRCSAAIVPPGSASSADSDHRRRCQNPATTGRCADPRSWRRRRARSGGPDARRTVRQFGSIAVRSDRHPEARSNCSTAAGWSAVRQQQHADPPAPHAALDRSHRGGAEPARSPDAPGGRAPAPTRPQSPARTPRCPAGPATTNRYSPSGENRAKVGVAPAPAPHTTRLPRSARNRPGRRSPARSVHRSATPSPPPRGPTSADQPAGPLDVQRCCRPTIPPTGPRLSRGTGRDRASSTIVPPGLPVTGATAPDTASSPPPQTAVTVATTDDGPPSNPDPSLRRLSAAEGIRVGRPTTTGVVHRQRSPPNGSCRKRCPAGESSPPRWPTDQIGGRARGPPADDRAGDHRADDGIQRVVLGAEPNETGPVQPRGATTNDSTNPPGPPDRSCNRPSARSTGAARRPDTPRRPQSRHRCAAPDVHRTASRPSSPAHLIAG